MTTPEFTAAMNEATNNPVPIERLPGLPTDPVELRAHMLWLEYRTLAGRDGGDEFKKKIDASFAEFMAGGDGLGPWRD